MLRQLAGDETKGSDTHIKCLGSALETWSVHARVLCGQQARAGRLAVSAAVWVGVCSSCQPLTGIFGLLFSRQLLPAE